ncbi:ankyrin repeat-containing domain protein [Pyronema domesticum]|nr:ankyrin repeat-containing domain protein [Pyronema domesticum]
MYPVDLRRFTPELLLVIGEQSTLPTLANLCAVNHSFHTLFTPILYKLGALVTVEKSECPFNPASWAIVFNDTKLLKKLLQYGLDPNTYVKTDGDRTSLLHRSLHSYEARLNEDTTITKLLLEHGADVHAKDSDGNSALHCAVQYTSVVDEFLVTAGVGRRDDAWNRLLLENGADPNFVGEGKRTPLHTAARYNVAVVIPLLLEFGADIEKKDGGGSTPFGTAVYMGSMDAARMLEENGAKIEY